MKNKVYSYIYAHFEKWTYDVWGNENDEQGFTVNDRYCENRDLVLKIRVQTANAGTPREFEFASPSDTILRRVFGLGGKSIEVDGDDLTIYVNLARNSYPVGELICTSHESLSPIREKITIGKHCLPSTHRRYT